MSVRSELRAVAMERAGSQCEWPYCGSVEWLEMSHIIPLGSGGFDTLENVWMLCKLDHDHYDGRSPFRRRELRALALEYVAERYGY